MERIVFSLISAMPKSVLLGKLSSKLAYIAA